MAPEDSTRPIMMSSRRFLDHVKDGYDAGKRYCFVLGAGASVTSGIPLGTTLIREWREFLLRRGTSYVEECARECGLDYASVAHLFAADYKVNSADYFTFHDLRFAGAPMHAYAHLQRLMMKAEPSFGYYALAVLLEHTQNKLVITTNFDSLVEESLALYHTKKRPLVIGHERLAPFMRDTTNTDRPVIAKVHRDLLLHPMNSEKELSKLDQRWVEPLHDALQRHTPIVIGYAGGDNSLMDFLADESLDTVYWCTLAKDESGESNRITDFLRKQEHGYLVNIKGFDQILYQLLDSLLGDEEYDTPDVRISEYAQSRADGYRRQKDRIANEVAGKSDAGSAVAQIRGKSVPAGPDGIPGAATGPAPVAADDAGADLKTLDKLTSSGTKDADLSNAALRAFNNSALAYAEGRFEDALAFDDTAIGLEPTSALYHHSRGTTLSALGRHEKALEEFEEAARLEPGEALYLHSCGTALNALGRNEEALAKLNEAIALQPNEALLHAYKGIILDALGNDKDALAEKRRAVQLNPDDALFHSYLGSALAARGRYEEALSEFDEAVRLDPDNTQGYRSRAIILVKLGRDDEALAEETRARELETESAK